MPAGVPKNSGDSKLSMPRMKLSITPLVSTGSSRNSVILRKVVQREAPHIRLASSSAGSMARKASTRNRNRKVVVYCDMCQITPP